MERLPSRYDLEHAELGSQIASEEQKKRPASRFDAAPPSTRFSGISSLPTASKWVLPFDQWPGKDRFDMEHPVEDIIVEEHRQTWTPTVLTTPRFLNIPEHRGRDRHTIRTVPGWDLHSRGAAHDITTMNGAPLQGARCANVPPETYAVMHDNWRRYLPPGASYREKATLSKR